MPNQRSSRPPRGARGTAKVENPGKTLRRVLHYMGSGYKFSLVAVVFCIILSALAQVYGVLFMRDLVDDYIVPLIGQSHADFGPLAAALGRLAIVFVVGILSAYGYNRIMEIGRASCRERV